MTVNYTTLLGLAKPVSGTESGTWGDTVNTNLTDYLDSAVAGAQIISGAQTAVTLSKTTGASLSQAGLSNTTGSSQYQIIRCTGSPLSLLTITAPTTDKTYIIINATSTSQSVKIVGVGPTPTGVTILSGKTSLVAWNGSDFVEVSPNTISGTLPVANGGTGATTLTGVLKGNGTSAFTAASSGTDYSAGTSALATGILKSTTSTGALTIAVAADFPTLNQSTTGTAATATNLASGSVGTIPYQSASGTTAMLAAGTSGNVLTCNGAAAPTWSTPAAATKTIVNTAVAYNVTATDLGKIINCTSGTFTVSLTAAATLGAGFTCTIWNTSNTASDAITIDPNGSETIDGDSTLILRRGEGLAVVCNGTNWETDDKKPMRAYAENFTGAYSRPIASGSESISMGNGSTASGGASIAYGYSSVAGSNNSVAFGINSNSQGSVTATGSGAMALGGSYASGTDSFAAAVADNTSTYGAQGTNSIAVGYRAKSTGNSHGMAMGANSIAGDTGFATAYGTASGYGSISMGYQTTASANYSVAIGSNSAGQGSKAVTGAGAMALGGSYASGVDSFAAAIANNTSSYGAQNQGSIAMGYIAKVSGSYRGTAIGGYGAIVSGSGGININSDDGSGWGSTVSGSMAVAIGTGNKSAQFGKYTYAAGFFAAQGDRQSGKIVISASTTTTTAVALTSDQGAAGTTNQLILASGQAMAIQGTLIAKQSGTGAMAGWNITGIVSNNGGTMAVSGLALTAIGSDSITLGAQPTIAVDNTNKGVTITSGYKSATNIRWVATLNTSEVTYA